MDIEKFKGYLTTEYIGRSLHYFEVLDSTNDTAKTLLEQNVAKIGNVVIASYQRSGHGKFARAWYSPKGGLWCSIILENKFKPNILTLACCVAAAEAVESINKKLKVKIKWPNDLLLNGKKVAGILIETYKDFVICGVGLNVNISDFPKELEKIATSILISSGIYVEIERLCASLCNQLEATLSSTAALIEDYKRRCIVEGKRISVKVHDRLLTGVGYIAADGRLILKTPTKSYILDSEEILIQDLNSLM